MQFIIGLIFGIIISTIGFGGVAHVADKGVQVIKEQTKEIVK
jgi:hypothetical protein